MKKILLLITLISVAITQAQIVNIPDVNFKNALLNASSANNIAKDINDNSITIDVNGDNEIQNSEAINVYSLFLTYSNISDLTGIESFTNLTHLNVRNNNLATLDLNSNLNIIELNCFNNNISNLNINNNTNLTKLSCSSNNISTLDLINNSNLTELGCSSNNISTLNLTNNSNLTELGCSSNNISTLNLTNNSNLTELGCSSNNISTLDLTNNSNLVYIDCSDNNLTTLLVNNINNPNLENIICSNNQLTSLDISDLEMESLFCSYNNLTSLILNNTILSGLNCNFNQLTEIDFSTASINYISISNNSLNTIDVTNNTELSILICLNNYFTTLDLSNNYELYELHCANNPNLSYINLKKGSSIATYASATPYFTNLPNLQTVCLDDINSNLTTFITTEVEHPVTFNEDCSIVATNGNQILGVVNLDINSNGCDSSDISMPNLMLVSNNGTDNFATFTQNNGDYLLYTDEGNFTTEVTTNLPNYFTINPTSQTNTFTGFDNSFIADFCIHPNQTVNDVNISVIPTSQARPGFNTTYQIVYKNVGTTQLSGNVTLEFDEAKLNFSNASETISSQTSNSVTFDYSNLNPFETRTIDLEFNVSTPPTTEIDDILNFITTINPITGDYTTDDNIFELNQTVVGSYDPNDITCLEGNQVLYTDKDKYLHYIIRFQNTGTASAINVVVKNILDNHLDWSTLQLVSLSHNNRVAIKNGNEIEFIFENIDLPDSTTDEPNSHGFIAYKIKPKTDIALDDIILNKADIFFDYNSPIETNTTSTRIVDVLAINENTLLDFSAYPTPTKNILNIKSKTEISKIEIYSKLGQLILKNETENNIDISNLTNGLYFVKVEDINGIFGVKKIMKK